MVEGRDREEEKGGRLLMIVRVLIDLRSSLFCFLTQLAWNDGVRCDETVH
jgi:hypothetical protein